MAREGKNSSSFEWRGEKAKEGKREAKEEGCHLEGVLTRREVTNIPVEFESFKSTQTNTNAILLSNYFEITVISRA